MLAAAVAYVKDIANATDTSPPSNSQEWYEDDETSQQDETLDEIQNDISQTTPVSKVSIKGSFLDHDIVKISINASNMQTPVLGLAFHLNYNPATLTFLRYDPGDFLEKGGDPFYLVSNSVSELIFGETLRRDDSFPIGGGEIASFYFQESNSSQEKYSFEFKNGVVSTLDTVRQDIDNIQFENAILDKNSPSGASDDSLGNLGGTDIEANVLTSGDSNFWLYSAFILGFASFILIVFTIKLRKKRRQNKICAFRSRGIESPQA